MTKSINLFTIWIVFILVYPASSKGFGDLPKLDTVTHSASFHADTAFANNLICDARNLSRLDDNDFIKSALKIYEDRLGKASYKYITANSLYSGILSAKDRKKEATELIKENVLLLDKIEEFDESKNTKCLVLFARNHLDIYDYHGAHKYYSKALKLMEAKNGDNYGQYMSLINQYVELMIKFKQLEECEKWINRALPSFDDDPTIPKSLKGRLLISLGKVFRYQSNEKEAVPVLLKGIDILKGYDNRQILVAIAYNNLAICYKNQGKYNEALDTYELGLNIYKDEYKKASHSSYNAIYHNMANVYLKQKNYDKALNYFNKALDGKEESSGKDSRSYMITLVGLAECKSALGLNNEAKDIYETAIAFYTKAFSEDHKDVISSKVNLASFYVKTKDLNKAEELLNSLHQKTDKSVKKVDYVTISIYNMLVDVYLKKNELEKAEALSLELFELIKDKFKYHPVLVKAHNKLAMICLKKGEYEKAHEHISNAFQHNKYDLKNDFTQVIDYEQLISSFKLKSKLILENQTVFGNQFDSLSFYNEKGIQLIDFLRENYIDEQSNHFVASENYSLYENLIDSHYKRFVETNEEEHIENAFKIFEKSKAQSIIDNIRRNAFSSLSLIPDKVKDEELSLKKEIRELEIKVSNLSEAEKKDSLLEILFTCKRKHERFKKDIKTNYEEYYNLAYDQESINLTKLKSRLSKENQALVSYLVGEDQLYIFSIVGNRVNLRKEPKDNYTQLLEMNTEKGFEVLESKEILSEMYDFLLGKELDVNLNFESLIIVPDGSLNLIPFEALLDKSGQALISKCAVSYAYSMTWLDQFSAYKGKAKRNIASFAPNYSEEVPEDQLYAYLVRSGNYNLPGAKAEVEKINEIIPSQLFLDSLAIERNLMENLGEYKIFHFAMHANQNDNPLYSKLLFSNVNDSIYDNELRVGEIMNTNINAELVVLSACSTGLGKISKGEGATSLAKAFAFSGVPSTVMSLWKVPDQATSYIMMEFYKNLKEGLKKDQSLRNAKLSYLKDDAIPESQKTPYHWAGFIATGNMDPIKFNSGSNTYLLFGGVFLLLGLGLYSKRKLAA